MSLPNARWMWRFAISGGLSALGLLALLEYGSRVWSFETHSRILSVTGVVWPGSIFLLATCGQEDTVQIWTIVGSSMESRSGILDAELAAVGVSSRAVSQPTVTPPSCVYFLSAAVTTLGWPCSP